MQEVWDNDNIYMAKTIANSSKMYITIPWNHKYDHSASNEDAVNFKLLINIWRDWNLEEGIVHSKGLVIFFSANINCCTYLHNQNC